MGYYTLHKISIINKYNSEKNLEKLWEVIKDVSGYGFTIYDSYLIDDTWNGGCGCKWYSFHSEIYKISEALPKFKILVEAKEENGNTWKVCVKGGDDTDFNYEESDSEEDDDDDDSNENEEELESNDENDVDEDDNNYEILENFENTLKLDDNEINRR